MAGRLLDAIGAHEGITSTPAEYVATAVRLASDPTAHREFKAHFTPEAWSASIGNIAQFTAEYEATLTRLAAGLRQA